MTLLRALLIAWLAVASPFTAFAATANHHCTHMQGSPGPQTMPFGLTGRAGDGRALHASHLDAAPTNPGPASYAAGTSRETPHAEPAGATATSSPHPADCCGGFGACAGHACASAASALLAIASRADPVDYSCRQPYDQLSPAHPEAGHHPPLLRPPA